MTDIFEQMGEQAQSNAVERLMESWRDHIHRALVIHVAEHLVGRPTIASIVAEITESMISELQKQESDPTLKAMGIDSNASIHQFAEMVRQKVADLKKRAEGSE